MNSSRCHMLKWNPPPLFLLLIFRPCKAEVSPQNKQSRVYTHVTIQEHRRPTLRGVGQSSTWERVACSISIANASSSFPYHVCAAFFAHPDLMPPTCVHIHPRPGAERLFRGLCIIWVRDRELATQNQMGREAGVLVRWIVGVSCSTDQRVSMA